MIIFGIHITWSWLLSICIGFLGIGIMILVHELGHAFAAKACGINVEVLRFGFGPALFKWYKGDTTYIIGVIPFGGSCKMTGNDDLQDALKRKKKYIESGEDGSLWAVGPIKRGLTYLAGPAANLLFAFLCCALLITLPSVVSHAPAKVAISSDYPSIYNIDSNAASKAGLKTGDLVLEVDGIAVDSYTHMQQLLSERKDNESVIISTNRGNFTVCPEDGIFGFVPFREPVVGYVNSDTPEKEAGLKAKDKIVTINGKAVTNMMDLLEASIQSTFITMTVERGDQEIELSFENPTSSLNFTLVQETTVIKGQNFGKALILSTKECLKIFSQSITSLINVFNNEASAGQALSGTFGASQSIGMLTTQGFAQSFNSGLRTMLYLLSCVSISLCVINLLPVPALDGGQMIVCFAELITRRTFNPKFYVVTQVIGFVLIGIAFVLISFT